MPFLDANKDLPAIAGKDFDVIIVGAGAAGIFLAVTLGRRGKRVLVLESGHFNRDENRQALNEIEQVGKSLIKPLANRMRVVGGTTTAWGGQSLPFTPQDFEARSWVSHSGWPLSFEALAPYYASANAFMGIDGHNYDTDLFAPLGRSNPGFDDKVLHYHFSKWASQPDFFKLKRSALRRDATVLYNAQLLRIDLDGNGRVATIEIGNFAGQRRSVSVPILVLAAGGIETNRILLLNDHQRQGGLGNHSDWLGKAFMEHPRIYAGHVKPTDEFQLQDCFGARLRSGRRYSVRLSAGVRWQQERQLLNVSAALMWMYEGREFGPLTELRSFVRRPRLKSAVRTLAGGGTLFKGLWHLATSGLIYKPGATAHLVLMCEQEPHLDSCIALSGKLDRFQLRQAQLNWRLTDKTWATLVHFAESVKAELERLGFGRVELFDHIRLRTEDWERHLSDAKHHMGGTRMSAITADGVVNNQMQVWGVPNLYVCSASVFPTGSHSNPTLTLLALSARLADHLAPIR